MGNKWKEMQNTCLKFFIKKKREGKTSHLCEILSCLKRQICYDALVVCFLYLILIFQVGDGGVGFIWLISEAGQEEEWRHSVAPIPVDKLVAIMQISNDEADLPNEDGAFLPPSGELGPDSITNDSNEDAEDIRDDSVIFEREVGFDGNIYDHFVELYHRLRFPFHLLLQVEATFQRAVEEDVTDDHVILEVNSLRYVN